MYRKTEGIVLGTSPYNDRYSITHLFTRHYGTVSYLLPKAKGKKTKIKTSLFFPLSLLQIEVEHLPSREIHRLHDVTCLLPVHNISADATKVAIAFFISEFLQKVMRNATENEAIFAYIRHSIEALNAQKRGTANFHLAFLVGLMRFLGINPNMKYESGNYFDLLNGEFAHHKPFHTHYISAEQSVFLFYLNRINYRNMHRFRLSRENRNEILNHLLSYYRLHLYDFPALKSLDVLREMG